MGRHSRYEARIARLLAAWTFAAIAGSASPAAAAVSEFRARGIEQFMVVADVESHPGADADTDTDTDTDTLGLRLTQFELIPVGTLVSGLVANALLSSLAYVNYGGRILGTIDAGFAALFVVNAGHQNSWPTRLVAVAGMAALSWYQFSAYDRGESETTLYFVQLGGIMGTMTLANVVESAIRRSHRAAIHKRAAVGSSPGDVIP